MLIVKAFAGLVSYALAVAGNAYAQTPPSAASAPSSITQAQNVPLTTAPPPRPVYPLKASSNNRYLVDQNNVPFLMVGDAPQTLIANLSQNDAATYMANRAKYGINTLWINLLCNYSDGCNKDATTFDGIPPFTVVGDLSTPNPAYFQRADDMINIAAANGMVVLLDPIETGSWLDMLRANGTAKAFEYGQWLGNRYKKFPNIIWMNGNDFQMWKNASDDALVQAVARGIRSRDPIHIHTVELNFLTSGSLDDPTWAPLIELNAAYTYFPTYAQVLTEYNRLDFKPVFLVEANYEFEHLQYTDGGSTKNLRRQEYWAMLSGATGQVYGSRYTWRFDNGWQTNLDTPGVVELGYMKDLFISRKWYDLIPDQTHTIVTAGYHGPAGYIGKLWAYFGDRSGVRRLFAYVKRFTGLGSIATNTYAPAARTFDGTLLIVYVPSIRTITVDMSKLAGLTIGRWYDPTSGRYTEAGDSSFANSGERQFTPLGTNQAGDGDWVLVLEVSRYPQSPN
jgi:Protein of unknown function (DUF4038)/Putative collagen-binding domain of a collagenase